MSIRKSNKPKTDPEAAAGSNSPDEQAQAETVATDDTYTPVGTVHVLGEAKRDGKTVRVLMDDKRVWKEIR